MVRMKLKLSILLLFALLHFVAPAQSVATGDKVRQIRHLDVSVTESEYLYIGFIHSSSEPCRLSTINVQNILKSRVDIGAIFLTRESIDSCQPWLQQLISNGEKVATEASDYFKRFGIDYAPCGMIIDHKYRIVWFGNPMILNNQRIDKILTQWTLQR